MRPGLIIIIALLKVFYLPAQNWTLELKSFVEYRTWKLTTKDVPTEKQLEGATIKMFKGSALVSQVSSDADGEFTLLVPANAVFRVEVSYPGCNTKVFAVETTGVPEEVGIDNYKPTFKIRGGFVMVKPYPGIDYSGLKESLIKVEYEPGIKNFDDNEDSKEAGLGIVSKIYGAEDVLFKKFCGTNKAGDDALAIPDCPLARRLYKEAIAMIPGEEYPVEQLKKVGDCLKAKEEEAKKAEEAAAKKAELEKAAKEKAAADKLAKEKAAAAKVETDKAAKEKQAADKLAKQKETEANKIAKEKEPVAKKIEPKKTEAEKITKQRTTEDDKNKPKPGKPKTEPIIGGKKTTPHEDDEMSLTGDKKHQVRHELGPNAYKNAIVRANDLFKMKRYEEARSFYEKALEAKPGDALATDRLEKIKKLLEGK